MGNRDSWAVRDAIVAFRRGFWPHPLSLIALISLVARLKCFSNESGRITITTINSIFDGQLNGVIIHQSNYET